MTSLKKLWEESHQLGLLFRSETPQTEEFQRLLAEFRRLEQSADPSLQKIGRLARIFEGHWDQRQWLNLLVPLERYLDRRLTDVDLLGFLPDRLSTPHQKLELYVIADHWRSAFNVGSLFRLADGFGIKEILLIGYTPTPSSAAVAKTALGSETLTPWRHFETAKEAIAELRNQGIPTWALETSPQSALLGESALPRPMAILLGNERFGIEGHLLNECTGTLKIPLRGLKNSMNVAQCLGIFAYEWCRQHGDLKTP